MYKIALILTLFSSQVGAQELRQDPGAATVVVGLPANAKLWIDDFASSQTGAQRIFITPPLQKGVTFFYTLRIELVRQGQLISSTKEIKVRSGEVTMVEFGEPRAPIAKSVPAKKAVPTSTLSRFEQELLDLTNHERKKAGLAPLDLNAKLVQAARGHSANMARQKKLDHTLEEKGPGERIRAAGYQGFTWGENIAYGMPTPASAMEAWMTSKGHRANILNGDFTEIGLGIVTDERGVPYYTQVFGRR
jgi:uncharacterized protein (TIGR03000 family)